MESSSLILGIIALIGLFFHAAVGKAFDPAALQAQMMGFYQALRK